MVMDLFKNILILFTLLLFAAGCATTEPAGTSQYPRMPDEYRGDGSDYRKNGNNKANLNPQGMSFYDAAETAADDDYFGVEVVSLEESKRILKERKKQEKQQ